MKLLSMTDFVLEQEKYWNYETTGLENSIRKYKDCVLQINNYAKFLKQPLKLGMFVHCDEDGNILEDIIGHGMIHNYSEKVKQYKQAKEKVLFEGFEIKDNVVLLNDKIFFASAIDAKQFFIYYPRIEDLSNHFLSNEIILTPNAINHIFG